KWSNVPRTCLAFSYSCAKMRSWVRGENHRVIPIAAGGGAMRDEQTAGQDAGAQQARLLTVGAVLGVLALGWALVVILAGLANPEFLSRRIPTPKLDIPAFPSDLP